MLSARRYLDLLISNDSAFIKKAIESGDCDLSNMWISCEQTALHALMRDLGRIPVADALANVALEKAGNLSRLTCPHPEHLTPWSEFGYSLLDFCRDPQILRELLSRGANPNGKNSTGKTALHSLLTEGGVNSEVEDRLAIYLEFGADLDVADAGNVTPRYLAMRRGIQVPDEGLNEKAECQIQFEQSLGSWIPSELSRLLQAGANWGFKNGQCLWWMARSGDLSEAQRGLAYAFENGANGFAIGPYVTTSSFAEMLGRNAFAWCKEVAEIHGATWGISKAQLGQILYVAGNKPASQWSEFAWIRLLMERVGLSEFWTGDKFTYRDFLKQRLLGFAKPKVFVRQIPVIDQANGSALLESDWCEMVPEGDVERDIEKIRSGTGSYLAIGPMGEWSEIGGRVWGWKRMTQANGSSYTSERFDGITEKVTKRMSKGRVVDVVSKWLSESWLVP